MGTLWDDEGRRPPDPDGLPGLPPEWGPIVIPDDLSELADEAAQLRRELRRERWRSRLHLPRRALGGARRPRILLAPSIVMVLAILLTVASLFAAVAPGRTRSTGVGRDRGGESLPDLVLADGQGTPVHLSDYRPAVVILVDGCACPDLTKATAAALPSGVALLLVGKEAVRDSRPEGLRLADPTGQLRAKVGAGTAVPEAATVLLVNRQGRIVRILPATRSVGDFSGELAGLRP